MSKIVLGLATMNAGINMPGSSLVNLITKSKKSFDRIICIDGNLEQNGIDLYRSLDIDYYSSPWTGSLKAQYSLLLSHLEPGDLWVMLDDDEAPSEGLLSLLPSLKEDNQFKYYATPRITCFSEDGYNFYMGEQIPTRTNSHGDGIATPRTHIYKITSDLQMMASPAGRHVVPYYNDSNPAYICNGSAYHMHFKAPELYVYNDCVKALFDHDIKDPDIEHEYRKMMHNNKITDGTSFLRVTKEGTVDTAFTDFCVKYMTHGAPEGRLFIWYYNICHPKLNPFPDQDWTASLKLVLNRNWRKTYIANRDSYHCTQVVTTSYPKGIGKITV